jgi:hypothetical protein
LRLFCKVESLHALVGREHLESVVGQLLFQVGPHRTFVLNQENRPPEHGGEASNAFAERLDVLSLRKIQSVGAMRNRLNHAVRPRRSRG